MSKSPVSNLGFHPQTTVPFSISFNSASLRVTAHSSSGVCRPQKAALTPHFSPPLGSTGHCALVRFPFMTGTFFKQLRALMYQTHLLLTETGKREHSRFLLGNTWHLVWKTLWSATQRLPPLSQEHLQIQTQIHRQGQRDCWYDDKAHLQHLCWQSTHRCCRLWHMSGKPVQWYCRSNETLRIEKLATDYYRFRGR